MIKSFIKRLFCNHFYQHIRNIYGDEIIEYGWKRSIWECYHCNKIQYRDSIKNQVKGFEHDRTTQRYSYRYWRLN